LCITGCSLAIGIALHDQPVLNSPSKRRAFLITPLKDQRKAVSIWQSGPLVLESFVKRLPARFVSVGARFLLTSCTVTVAQQPSDATTPPAEASPAPASVQNEAVPPTDTVDKPAFECKGLAEKRCRNNKICTWIIPRDANKRGQVPPAYCRKLGPTKAKAKNAGAPATAGASAQ
jgi:hypothetical protein